MLKIYTKVITNIYNNPPTVTFYSKREMVEINKTYEVKVMITRSNIVPQEEVETQVIQDLFSNKADYDKWLYNVAGVKESKADKPDYVQLFKDFSVEIAQCFRDTELSDYKLKELGLVFDKHLGKIKQITS